MNALTPAHINAQARCLSFRSVHVPRTKQQILGTNCSSDAGYVELVVFSDGEEKER